MPFPFTLPTTSSFSFSSSYSSSTHPSLPQSSSTPRGLVRDTLKKHKRLPPPSQSPNLPAIATTLTSYLPYLLALSTGLRTDSPLLRVEETSTPTIEWRPTLTDAVVPGREGPRVKIRSIDHEISFVLLTLANVHTLLARTALHPLYLTTSTATVGSAERTTAIQSATKSLLDAASVYEYGATRAENTRRKQQHQQQKALPCVDISPSTFRALAALAHAEATLLAVLKDDPYPAVVAQDRNKNDKEWMYKSPDIPKVRAHLFARLCLAAAEHAARASALLQAAATATMAGKIDAELARYVEDVRRTSRAKACRFFGVDAELGGQTGTAIAWLNAGLQELGVEGRREENKKGFGLGRLRKEWSEKREDRKVEREEHWGLDGGKLEETRVIDTLLEKWNKMNDTVLTQAIPPTGPLLAKMPTGREIHSIQPFQPPTLDRDALDSMRAPPEQTDDFGGDMPSSEDESEGTLVGAYPSPSGDVGRSASTSTGYY